jgi:hypothetical protein
MVTNARQRANMSILVEMELEINQRFAMTGMREVMMDAKMIVCHLNRGLCVALNKTYQKRRDLNS